MAYVICDMDDCIHRSKRKLKNWIKKDGSNCYGCSLPVILISRILDSDGEVEAVVGKENTAICNHYQPQPEESEE